MLKILTVVLAAFIDSCAGAPRPTQEASEAPSSGTSDPQSESADQHPVHHFSDNWGNGPGCTPKGEVLSLEGTIVIRPFGKGTDGALLKTDKDEWVISYRAEGTLLEMRDKTVLASGRACDKQGEAVAGKHFDLMTLTEAPGSTYQ
jgi:hypothetical protein